MVSRISSSSSRLRTKKSRAVELPSSMSSPFLIRWQLRMMRPSSCRFMIVSSVEGIAPEAIKSFRMFPGPTEGSW